MDDKDRVKSFLQRYEDVVYETVTASISEANNDVLKSKIITGVDPSSGLYGKHLVQAMDSADQVLGLVQQLYRAGDKMTIEELNNLIRKLVLENLFNIIAARLIANIDFPVEDHAHLLKITKKHIAHTRELGYGQSANLMELRANRINN